jgi:hypothetical protein
VSSKPRCPDAEAALVQALMAALDNPLQGQHLTSARFGRYTDPANGWSWSLKFESEVGDTGTAFSDDSPVRRFNEIVRAWSRDIAKYRKEEAGT